DLLDVEADLAAHHLAQVAAQRLDVLALLADDHARPRAVDRDARVLGRPLDRHLGDGRVRQLLLQVLADLDVLVQRGRVVLAVREPLRSPVAVDRKAQPGLMYLLSHGVSYFPSPTTMRMWQVCLPI